MEKWKFLKDDRTGEYYAISQTSGTVYQWRDGWVDPCTKIEYRAEWYEVQCSAPKDIEQGAVSGDDGSISRVPLTEADLHDWHCPQAREVSPVEVATICGGPPHPDEVVMTTIASRT